MEMVKAMNGYDCYIDKGYIERMVNNLLGLCGLNVEAGL